MLPDDGGDTGRADTVEVKRQHAGQFTLGFAGWCGHLPLWLSLMGATGTPNFNIAITRAS